MRIGDAERMQAMDTLGRALGEGRLTMEEFDQRCNQVAKAQTNNDLRPILADLPAVPVNPQPLGGSTVVTSSSTALQPRPVYQPVDLGGEGANKLYSAQEIQIARRAGQRKRAGAFWLGTFGAIGATMLFDAAALTSLANLSILIIPTLFILLYVMKVGPADWYQPSLRELEKHRREAIRAQQLELEQAHALEIAQRKMDRKAQIDQLTGDALDVARNTVNRFKPQG